MDELDGDGAGQGHGVRRSDGLGGKQCQGRTNGLAAVAARGPSLRVDEPEVIADHSPDLWRKRRHAISQGGPKQVAGSEQGGGNAWHRAGLSAHADTASGSARVRPMLASASLAAASPDRTAPSMVAGHPVSVQAPAR